MRSIDLWKQSTKWLWRVILGAIIMSIALLGYLLGTQEVRRQDTTGGLASITSLSTAKVADEFDTIQLPKAEAIQLKGTWQRMAEGELKPFELGVDLHAEQQLGIIVPHHLLASDAILRMFSAIKDFNPDVIVLLSPNHQSDVFHPVITTKKTLAVENQLYAMSELVATLTNTRVAVEKPDLFLVEHGVFGLLPFIGYNEWEAPIIPLVVARNVTDTQLSDLRIVLDEALNMKRVLWIASIDFSHYLPAAAAAMKDKETQKWIENADYARIMQSTSAHLDAPGVLTFWLQYFQQPQLVWHSNSAEIMGSGFHVPGTSYMVYWGRVPLDPTK